MSDRDTEDGSDERDPLEWVMDRLVYGPYGALTELTLHPATAAESGRRRLEQQIRNARFLGEMTLTHGSRELKRRIGDLLTGGAASPEATRSEQAADASTAPHDAAPAAQRIMPDPVDHILAGYDDLSASQVVKLLDALSIGELQSVVTYEEATRGRRTILTRAGQLIDRG